MPDKQTRLEKNVTAALRSIQKLKNVPTSGLTTQQVDRVREALDAEVAHSCDMLRARVEERPSFSLEGE